MLQIMVNPGVELGNPATVDLSTLRVYCLFDEGGSPLVTVRRASFYPTAGMAQRDAHTGQECVPVRLSLSVCLSLCVS
jgi:hypothetical protein